ncbi:unnamed protein product, partial [Allacma fusca]
PSELQ